MLSDLRAVISTSYQDLDEDTARFFRRLSLHPGPEFSPGAAAALTGTPLDRARKLLEQLTRAHLVERPHAGRYRLHDLVRLYAVERVRAEDPVEHAHRAVGDVARWYVHAAARAQLAEQPNFPVVPGGERPEELPGVESADQARVWFEAERANLVAATESALEHGHHDLAWRLPATVYPLFELHRHWHEWRDLHTLGLRAAAQTGDPFGAARNHLGMGDARWLLGELDEAVRHYRAALQANEGVADAWIEGFALRQLGEVSWQRGEHEAAREFVERAVGVFRDAGERRGEAMGLLSLAESGADSGHWRQALERCREAVAVFEAIGEVWSVAWAGCTLGRVLTGSGRAAEAVEEYRAAARVFEEHGDADSRAVALLGLGHAHVELGEVERARQAWGAALDYFTDHGDPRAARTEERLRGLKA
ncbi:tetratricopeptide repeat protein [Nocardiopsis xinjiangensis]|uniref:tetratricopeptide repeat protein n=1 Tax=Nocardiopsis xinjiangensis TaxID=124285 RepID=UPI0003702E82|nr:tetratricopeptide repeat protein [Nocardiopsis xinjiangensis]